MTTSSMRIGSVKASWIPAIKFLSAGWAAAATARPAIPADANRVSPTALTAGMVISMKQSVTTPTRITDTR